MRTSRRQIRSEEKEDNNQFEVYAWNIMGTLHTWTTKVDTKASVILSVETAAFGLILVFAGHGKPLGNLSGVSVWPFRAGITFLALAITTAGAAIFPQLNRREARRNWRGNYAYFGHLRHWSAPDLVQSLQQGDRNASDLVLSTEIIALSKIIWRKHSFIQCSMALVASGDLALLLAWILK